MEEGHDIELFSKILVVDDELQIQFLLEEFLAAQDTPFDSLGMEGRLSEFSRQKPSMAL